MKNFFVRFKMATPIVFGYRKPFTPIMFDGLLTWMLKGDAKSADMPDVPLPLEQSGEKYRYYHASAWELKDPKFGTFCWVKTVPERWAKRDLKTPQMLELVSYVSTPEVTFYARGNMNDVVEIINQFGSISLGSKRVSGWGRVIDIEAGELLDDQSVWDKLGRPARPIPVEEAPPEKITGNGIVPMPYKPPYWSGEAVPCLIPSIERWWPGIRDESIAELEQKIRQAG